MSREEFAASIVRNAGDDMLRASMGLLVLARDLVDADPILRISFAMQLQKMARSIDPDLEEWQSFN